MTSADGILQRFYSMSAQIILKCKQYYQILEKTQRGNADITKWLEWFLICLNDTLIEADKTLSGVINKARYWDWLKEKTLNERKRRMINKILDGQVIYSLFKAI
ncbi:MAG: hypothetical protein IT223_06165 [Crocinitomicaceae bacterium]|nr:hypothetical protein [Crocinitomicaceae bacterium]